MDILRVRVIGFRDYLFDGDGSMVTSDFFTLPEQSAEFESFVRELKADGGGDEPESGLEALALAIKSPWKRAGDKNRQVIVFWTDASAHPLEAGASSGTASYPDGLPANFDELTDWWEGQSYVNKNDKRLILFTPSAAGWSEIVTHWEQTIHLASQAGAGLAEHEYSTILGAIANSV
ncbi:VWA domain-containing protein [Kribbella sp. NPDC051620]|uniref:VWA domain-containing protein n=1 Tax=Kribbella sp. NPDC051620 TaxID=3364120 RepID=UPI00379B3D32